MPGALPCAGIMGRSGRVRDTWRLWAPLPAPGGFDAETCQPDPALEPEGRLRSRRFKAGRAFLIGWNQT